MSSNLPSEACSHNSQRVRGVVAAVCGCMAVVFNTKFAGWFLTADGVLEGNSLRLVIHVVQGGLVLSGLLLWQTDLIPLPGRRQLLLLCLSSVLSIAAVEIATRCWLTMIANDDQRAAFCLYTEIPPQDWQWSPHHYLNYFPTPHYRKGLTHHNSLGFRGDEISLPKPDGVYRIVILGGSTTYTIAVEDDSLTFPAQLQKILRSTSGGSGVEVINAGVGGYNSWESLINLQYRVLDLEPDVVIVYHGTNDVHPRLVPPEIYKSDNSGRRVQWHNPRIAPVEYSAFLRIALRKIGVCSQVGLETMVNRNVEVPSEDSDVIERLNQNLPVYFQKNLGNMYAASRRAGAEFVFTTWAHSPNLDDYASTAGYQHGFRQNNEVVRTLAQDSHAPLLDLAKMMPQDVEFWADGRHVNEAGARKKAELFAEFLQEQDFWNELSQKDKQKIR